MRQKKAKQPHSHLLYWLFLLVPTMCSATLIITVWSPTRILIGADGLALHPGQPQPYERTCKIRQATNDCFFSIDGAQDFKGIHYDLVPLFVVYCAAHVRDQINPTLDEERWQFGK
jgi:hypothetical protein